MDNLAKLQEICLRLDHLEATGDWLSRALVHEDSAASQSGTLVSVLAEDIREKVMALITELESELSSRREYAH